MKKGFTLIELLIVLCILPGIILAIGWCMNVYKTIQLDFEEPYKAEIIRMVGIAAAPLGGIVGFMDIEDGKPNPK